MNTKHLTVATLLGIASAVGLPAHAHDATHTATQTADTSAPRNIERVMKALFDKPGAPLTVAPITVEGEYALAGWTQSDKGGRALLRQAHGKWSIEVCGGDGLKEVSALTATGMSHAVATRLTQRATAAEKKLPPQQVRQFSMFDGVVRVDGGAHSGHDAAHGGDKPTH